MINAPFLLQAFAARMLAAKNEETVSRADLVRQGYDVETLVDMIEAYMEMPETQRAFIVRATADEITIRRKSNGAAPTPPSVAMPPASHPATPDSRPPLPHAPDIASLVSYSAKQRLAATPKKPGT